MTVINMLAISDLEIEIIVKLTLATVLGAVIGLEREFNKSAAGIKTYSIVSLGSALFTVASVIIDIKLAAGVITGIGFLGAATVFKTENKVVGLTTAALIWSTASLGFAVGLGLYFAAIVTTVILLIILIPIEYIEKNIIKMHWE
jgi:putative Mg2+ transporter-C (MgtC) family protein